MNIAPINKIIPLSLVDGPGNRTSIFLQGCNIACTYCHNPETQKICCNCGLCVEGCPVGALSFLDQNVKWDEKSCVLCDRCITICPNYASPRIKMMTAEEVFTIVKKGIPFIRGITVSGGECTLYMDFLSELFSLAKSEGLNCLIDSNGMVDFSKHLEVIHNCDGVMLDIKSWDAIIYKNLTGSDNNVVKKNLNYLADMNKLEEIRIVCVPGEVDAEAAIQGIQSTIGKLVEKTQLKLIKFRSYGVKGILENKKSPDNEYMEALKQKALEIGYKNIIIT